MLMQCLRSNYLSLQGQVQCVCVCVYIHAKSFSANSAASSRKSSPMTHSPPSSLLSFFKPLFHDTLSLTINLWLLGRFYLDAGTP